MITYRLAIYLPYWSSPDNPSTRVRRLNLQTVLKFNGIPCEIITFFSDLHPYTHVLFSHLAQEVLEEITLLKAAGKVILYDHCENLTGLAFQKEIFQAIDYLVCCSTRLEMESKKYFPGIKTLVVKDFVESTPPFKDQTLFHTPVDRQALRVLYVGMGGNAFQALKLQSLIQKAGMQLFIMSEWADAHVKWELDNYLEKMMDFDIIVCPQIVELQPAKSNIKLTTALALGLPTVCSPLPAYLEVAKHKDNCYVARNPDEWLAAFLELRDFKKRQSLNQYLKQHPISDYYPFAIASQWAEILRKTSYDTVDTKPQQVKVGVINNSLPIKYFSPGDRWMELWQESGFPVENLRYENWHYFYRPYSLLFSIEIRYPIQSLLHPLGRDQKRVLITKEPIDLNYLAHFHYVISDQQNLVTSWRGRGFTNCFYFPDLFKPTRETVLKLLQLMEGTDSLQDRKQHNLQLHSNHIDSFQQLQIPENRWKPEASRDYAHIQYTMGQMPMLKAAPRVLDVGSADGWLSLYLATKGYQVSCLEIVERGIAWTQQHAKRLGVRVDLRKGFFEDVDCVFKDSQFDLITVYETLEHLDYLSVPDYLEKLSTVLAPDGKILISLPSQQLQDNLEHLWTPTEKMNQNILTGSPKFRLIDQQWVPIANHGVPGNWFYTLVANNFPEYEPLSP